MAGRRFSGTSAQHGASARYALQDARRIQSRMRTYLRSPPDCVTAANMLRALFLTEGHYTIDRQHSGTHSIGSGLSKANRALHERFVNVCVVRRR
jgi:hypothetical protein